jgi:hypothetical protein
LTTLANGFAPDLRAWFADDPGRVERFTFPAGDLHVDLSKSFLDDDVLAALLALADEVGVAARRDAMFAGDNINVTEDRADRPWRSTGRTSSARCTTCCDASTTSPSRSAAAPGAGSPGSGSERS